jgi:hypothetical protein
MNTGKQRLNRALPGGGIVLFEKGLKHEADFTRLV